MQKTQAGPGAGLQSAPVAWHVLVLLTAAVIALFSRFFRANTFGFFEDDFFYYVVAAKNFAAHHVSTFDGTHLTNGYHPLWFLVVAGIVQIFSGTAFLVAMQVVALLLLVLFFFMSRLLFERLGLTSTRVPSASLLVSLHALLLFRYGMEVTVSLPLGIAALVYALAPSFRWTDRQSFLYGLLAALAVLGRLDSILLFGPLMASQLWLSGDSLLLRLRRGLLLLAGFAPFAAYLLINHFEFHSLLPISGHAKQLKPLFPPSFVPWKTLVLPFDRMKAAFVYPALLLTAAGIVRLCRVWSRMGQRERPVYVCLLLFPIVHLTALGVLSDWSLWPWYYYGFTYASVAALALLLRESEPARSPALVWTMRLASCFYVAYVSVYAVSKQPSKMALLAADVASFAREHPAMYAMGDEAGTMAYLSQQPILQLEGLMMDEPYLHVIATETPLATVLSDYHARYYVTLQPKAQSGCITLAEPGQAGRLSPHMMGKICAQPLRHFERENIAMDIFDASTVQ